MKLGIVVESLWKGIKAQIPEGAAFKTAAVGADGELGALGAPGVVGEPGTVGAVGEPGSEGAVGEPGTAGVAGEPGIAGAVGESGTDGAVGELGEPDRGVGSFAGRRPMPKAKVETRERQQTNKIFMYNDAKGEE